MDELFARLAALARKHGAEKLVLFGSRARGDNTPTSDIDLAVYGMPEADRSAFWWDVDELPTLLEFDLIHISPDLNAALLNRIEQEGRVLMDRTAEKLEKLKDAISRLEEAIAEYGDRPSKVVRDGAIQRFEFCTELAWKATREYLLDQGYTEINSPKSVMKKAYADGVISDETGWLALLNDRNLTSHMYDDETAQCVFGRIQSAHLPLLCALRDRLICG